MLTLQSVATDRSVEHYRTFIQKNPECEFAGIFADDGNSGTNTKKREEFNRMIEECMLGHIDMIITKSISRFARNTLDCLKYIRELKDKNIPVFFEKENINTMDLKGEVLLTIMASLAQQESESLSKNVKLGLQFRYQNGEVQVNHNRFMGYIKDEKGQLIIEPSEVEIVKRIYREYLEGASLKQIGEGLEADGILTAPTIQESELQNIVVRAINQVLRGKDEMIQILEENIAAVLAFEDEGSLESIQARLEEKQRELLKLASSHQNYDNLDEEINELWEQKQSIMVENPEREGLKIRIDEIKRFLDEQINKVEEYDKNLVRRIIEKVTVYDEYLTVEFKSGISVDIRR